MGHLSCFRLCELRKKVSVKILGLRVAKQVLNFLGNLRAASLATRLLIN